MTHDQYWNQDPLLVLDFRRAERLRQKRRDAEAWLQGAYVYDAIGRLAPVLHPFAKKNAKPLPYLEKPYLAKEEAQQADQERIVENERLKAVLFFKNWARAAKKHFEE